MFQTAHSIEGYRERCQDRLDVIRQPDRTIVVVADGAGGSGDGGIAAEVVIREVQSHHGTIETSMDWSRFLTQLDHRITSGETTAAIVDLRPDRILGASVGDSRVWIVQGPEVTDLTRTQHRKPLLGSGNATPAPFWHGPLDGVLIAGSDGLFDYAKRDQVTATIATTDFYSLPRACIELVRLPSGGLWDDTAVMVCRHAPARRTRQRFTL